VQGDVVLHAIVPDGFDVTSQTTTPPSSYNFKQPIVIARSVSDEAIQKHKELDCFAYARNDDKPNLSRHRVRKPAQHLMYIVGHDRKQRGQRQIGRPILKLCLEWDTVISEVFRRIVAASSSIMSTWSGAFGPKAWGFEYMVRLAEKWAMRSVTSWFGCRVLRASKLFTARSGSIT